MWEGKTNIFITDPISELSNKGGLKYNIYNNNFSKSCQYEKKTIMFTIIIKSIKCLRIYGIKKWVFSYDSRRISE